MHEEIVCAPLAVGVKLAEYCQLVQRSLVEEINYIEEFNAEEKLAEEETRGG